MASRCFGVEAAISGGNFPHSDTRTGFIQIVDDVVEAMLALAEAWEAEMHRRTAEAA